VSLTDAFTTFLGKRRDQDRLVDELERAGHRLEASLLADFRGGIHQTEPWRGRPAWVGARVPAQAQPGDIWLDVAELMPMLQIESLGWFATRPVERWQIGAFLSLAKTRGGRKVGDLHPLDRSRLLRGAESEPVDRVLLEEAVLYAEWFGKLIADRSDWQVVAETMATDDLWGPLREWSDELYEGVYSVVAPGTVDDEEFEDDQVFRLWEAPAGVGFRTIVRHDLGLFTETGEAEATGVRLRNQAPRDR
jgi:hypothetical protein